MATESDRGSVDVLLVEDDDDDAAYVERLLTGVDAVPDADRLLDVATLERVDHLEAGLTVLDDGAPDLVLLDLMLPDSEGLATLESVAGRAPHLPIVVLTGRTDAGLGPRAIQEGAQDYLTKGRITDEVLRRSLRYALDRHETHREIVHANHRLALLNSIVRQDVRDDVSTVVGWGEALRESVDPAEEEIAVALTYLLERSKTLVEGAGAVPMAALLFERFDYDEDETIVPALCGGNIDTNQLTTVLVRGLVETGRYLKIRTVLRDRPGALEDLVEIISDQRANIYAIQHDRTSRDVAMNEADVEIDIETRGHDHIEKVLGALRDAGYTVEVLA